MHVIFTTSVNFASKSVTNAWALNAEMVMLIQDESLRASYIILSDKRALDRQDCCVHFEWRRDSKSSPSPVQETRVLTTQATSAHRCVAPGQTCIQRVLSANGDFSLCPIAEARFPSHQITRNTQSTRSRRRPCERVCVQRHVACASFWISATRPRVSKEPHVCPIGAGGI